MATKDWESCETFQKHLSGTFHRWTGSLVTVSWLDVLQRLSGSVGRMDIITIQAQEHFVKPLVSEHSFLVDDHILFYLYFTRRPGVLGNRSCNNQVFLCYLKPKILDLQILCTSWVKSRLMFEYKCYVAPDKAKKIVFYLFMVWVIFLFPFCVNVKPVDSIFLLFSPFYFLVIWNWREK